MVPPANEPVDITQLDLAAGVACNLACASSSQGASLKATVNSFQMYVYLSSALSVPVNLHGRSKEVGKGTNGYEWVWLLFCAVPVVRKAPLAVKEPKMAFAKLCAGPYSHALTVLCWVKKRTKQEVSILRFGEHRRSEVIGVRDASTSTPCT